jgi:hypothetical protein
MLAISASFKLRTSYNNGFWQNQMIVISSNYTTKTEDSIMTSFDDRQKAFESKYAYDQDVLFRIEARACKLFGLWIAEQIGLSGDEAADYAGTIVSSNLEEPGFDDVLRAVKATLAEKYVEISDHILQTQLEHFLEEARVQVAPEGK